VRILLVSMVSVQFCVDSAYQSPRSFLSNCLRRNDPFPFQSFPTREQIRIMLRTPVRSANRDKSLGEAPRYTHLEFPVQKRITPNQNSAWLQAPIKRSKQPLGFPLLAAFSVGSPPAQLSAALRVRHFVSALRVCGQAPSRL